MTNTPKILAYLSLTAIGLYADTHTSAQDPMPITTSAVYLASPNHSFEVGFRALVLQPTGSNLSYAAEAYPLPAPSPHWEMHGIDTDYHFGFDLGFAYLCHSTHSKLALNWEHFHSSDSASVQVGSTNMIGPFFEIGPDAITYKQSSGKVTFHFDEASIDYGFLLQLGNRLQTNVFGGISFARIKQTRYSTYASLDDTTKRIINIPSTFLGAGPELGVDLSFRIAKGFSLAGNATGSLLVGPQKNHTDYEAYSPALADLGITPPNQQSTQGGKNTQVVPGFSGRIGFAYAYEFAEHYMFKIEAGYEAKIYLNAIQSADISSEVVTPPVTPDTVGVFARTFHTTLSNFALAGPYVALNLGF